MSLSHNTVPFGTFSIVPHTFLPFIRLVISSLLRVFLWKLKFYVDYVLEISTNLYIALRRLFSVFSMIKWPRAERSIFNLVSFTQHLYNSICHFHVACTMYNTLNGVASPTRSLQNSMKRPMELIWRCNSTGISLVMLAATSSDLRRNKFSISARCLQQASLSCSFSSLEKHNWLHVGVNKMMEGCETNTYDTCSQLQKNSANIWFHNVSTATFLIRCKEIREYDSCTKKTLIPWSWFLLFYL
jgi:hypothetical protein